MNLQNVYEEYNNTSKEYINLINNILKDDLKEFNYETLVSLKEYKEKFEVLMERASEIITGDENEINLKDLKYLILDTIFLSSDLMYFYDLKETERFKMRFANFLNKRRRAEFGF